MSEKNDNKVPNVPNLRFPTFVGTWQKTTMGEICSFCKGYGISKDNLSSDGTPCILYGELYTTYKTAVAKKIKSKTSLKPEDLFHSKKNDVIIPCSGETAEDIATSVCIPYDDILLGGDLTVIRSSLDGAFLSNQLNSARKYDIARIAQGKSIVHLQADELKKINIVFPSIEEQRKISSFIDLIDERIEVQNKIIEDIETLKKWIINQQFASDANCAIGAFIEQTSERNKINSVDRVLSVSNKYGFINQSEQFEDREVASDDRTNYKIVRRNDFAFNPARINVGSIAKLDTYDIGIVSPMYICFKCNNKNLDVDYLSNFFLSNSFKNALNKRLEGSVRQCLQFDALCDIKLFVPSLDDQISFVSKIKAITKKLTIEKDILTAYKKQKAYLLSNMFI